MSNDGHIGRDSRPYADEVDLVDLYIGLARHWKGMLLAFLAVLALSVGAAFWITPNYQFQAVISLGGDGNGDGVKTFVAPESVKATIENVFLPEVVGGLKEQYPMVDRFTIQADAPKDADVVVVSVKAPLQEAPMAKAVLKELSAKVMQRQKSQYDTRVASIRSSYQSRIGAVQARIASLQEGIAAKGLDAADKAKMVDQLETLKEQKVNLTEAMQNALNSLQATALVGDVSRSPKPLGLSAPLIIVLGGVLAVIAGFLIGLMLMFMDAVRTRRAAS
ncbi:MAG: hypothetical protein PVI37_12045 [Gammaproteobacteria bacterium]|jgi:hypothetical protein